MEGEAVHVGEVAHEQPDAVGLLRGPEPDGPVVGAGGEVVALRGKLDLPDGEDVSSGKWSIKLKKINVDKNVEKNFFKNYLGKQYFCPEK